MKQKMLVFRSIIDRPGTKLQKGLKQLVQERYDDRVAPVGADRLLLEDIRQMALQLNMLNSHCKPVEIVYNKNHRDADAQISWIGMKALELILKKGE